MSDECCEMDVLTWQAKTGGWVFLANCQLMTRWLPKLEKIIQALEKSQPHPEFRLWLSSVPNDKFPIGILQRSVKMTAEPPKVPVSLFMATLFLSIQWQNCPIDLHE